MKDSHPNYQKETSSTEDYKDIEFVQWLVFFLLIALIPCTIWLWKKFHPKPIAKTFDCTCEGCEKKSDEKCKLAKLEMNSTTNKVKIGLIAALWVLFLFLLFIVLTSTPQVKEPYNPYTVLGIEQGATTDEIKRAHKLLSLKYHPDKVNLKTMELTAEEAEEIYMSISKAYQALTDDATKEKWEKYGNPDGPQRMAIGIALPSWLINKSNSPIVLTIYLLLLVVALPGAVYYWNKGTESKGPVAIEQQSLALYYHIIDGTTRLKAMIEILAATTEYKSALPERKSDDEQLKAIYKQIPDAYKVKKARFNAPYIIKGTILLYAHITRVKDMSPQLKEDLNQMLKTYRHYLTGAFQITREKRQLVGLVELVRLSQCILQSAWEDQSLKQLPHVDGFIMQALKSNHVQDIGKFKGMEKEKRKELLQKAGVQDNRKIKDIENILEKIPCATTIKWKITSDNPTLLASSVCILEVEFTDLAALRKQKQEELAAAAALKEKKASASVPNPALSASSLTPSTKVGGVRKRIVKKSTTKDGKDGKDNKTTEEDETVEEEEESEAIVSKKEKKAGDDDSDSDIEDEEYSDSDDDDAWEKVPKKSLINPGDKDLIHTPFTFDDKPVGFWIFLGNKSRNELVALGKAETFTPGTIVKYPFLSAAEVGQANYTLYVMCDGYIGCDVETEIYLQLDRNPRPMVLQNANANRPPQQTIPEHDIDPKAMGGNSEASSSGSPATIQPSKPVHGPQPPPPQQQQSPQQQAPLPDILPPAIQPSNGANSPAKPLTQKQINQQQKKEKKLMRDQK